MKNKQRYVVYDGPHGLKTDPVLQTIDDKGLWHDIPTIVLPHKMIVRKSTVSPNKLVAQCSICGDNLTKNHKCPEIIETANMIKNGGWNE